MLRRVVRDIASRGTPYGWMTLKGFKNVRCIGHAGWLFENFKDKDPKALKEILLKKYLDEEFSKIVLGKGMVLPAELLTTVVTHEGAFSGVVPMDLGMNGDSPENIQFPGSNALPDSWIPDIVEVLQEMCKHYESLSAPGRKFMFAVTSTFFHHDTEGNHKTVEHEGKTFKLASNVAITVTSDTFLLANKWEADPGADKLGEYMLKSDWERLSGAIKDEMEAKVHLLSGETDGLRGTVSLICRDITQIHTLRLEGLKPDAVLFYFPTNGHPTLRGLKTPSDCRFLFFMCEGQEHMLESTGLYEVVPGAKEWRILKDKVALGKSMDLPNIFTAAWDWVTGATESAGKHLIDRGGEPGGIIKHIIPSKLTGGRGSWIVETEVFTIRDEPPKEDQYSSLVEVWKDKGEKGNKDGTHGTLPESDPQKPGFESGEAEVHFGEHPRLEDKHPHKDGRKY